MRRAAKDLHVNKKKGRFGSEGKWLWSLDEDDSNPPAIDDQAGWSPMADGDHGHLWQNPHEQTISAGTEAAQTSIDDHAVDVDINALGTLPIRELNRLAETGDL